MMKISKNVLVPFREKLEKREIFDRQQPYYEMWLRFYLDFCDRNDCPESNQSSVDLFTISLESRGKGMFQQKQAALAANLFLGLKERIPSSP